MALPLPRVVPDVGPGGRVWDVFKNLTSGANELAAGQSAAQYAPYTNYANALSKIAYANLLPYQIQSTIMSNPLIWQAFKDKPEALNAMLSNFMNTIPQATQGASSIGMPKPDQMGGGLLANIFGRDKQQEFQPKMIGGLDNSESVNPELQQPANPFGIQREGSPLLPSTEGGIAGISGRMTAPNITSPFKGGSLIENPQRPGEAISIPTESTKTAFQSSINAAERVAPQLERIADLAGPFLSLKGMADNQVDRVLNLVDPAGQRKLPAQYAKYQSILKAAPEALVKSYGLRPTNETIHRMQQIIEPYTGETKEQYKERILDQLKAIQEEQVAIPSRQLERGFELSKNRKEENISPGAKNLAKGLELPEFSSKEHFQEWYARQPKMTRDAVKLRLRNQ